MVNELSKQRVNNRQINSIKRAKKEGFHRKHLGKLTNPSMEDQGKLHREKSNDRWNFPGKTEGLIEANSWRRKNIKFSET